jgi:SAM-dependent methyltransferase
LNTHDDKVAQWLAPLEMVGGVGVEIGAGNSPIPGIWPVYVDCFREFGFEACRGDYYGHACMLPFHDHSLDYVASSHVLEHVANPVAAFAEWYRVLKPGGLIYLVVPDRRHTWDHTRPLTPVEHFLEDFERGTTPCDATHIDDFAGGSDWKLFSPSTPPEDVAAKQAELARGMHEAVARGEHINIHFHTFEPANLLELIARLRTWPPTRFKWEVVDQAERFPDTHPQGFLVVIRVNKGWRERAEADWFRIRTNDSRLAVVREDAEPFADFVKRCRGLGGVQ